MNILFLGGLVSNTLFINLRQKKVLGKGIQTFDLFFFLFEMHKIHFVNKTLITSEQKKPSAAFVIAGVSLIWHPQRLGHSEKMLRSKAYKKTKI